MTEKHPITIDGQEYDPVTGLPVTNTPALSEKLVEPAKTSTPVHYHSATHLHGKPQRSTTLHRRAVKRPSRIIKHEPAVRFSDIKPHASVRKFAPHPVGALAPKAVVKEVEPTLIPHPHVVKAHAKSAIKADVTLGRNLPTASEIKDSAITTAVQNTQKQPAVRRRLQPRQRVAAVLSAAIALVLLGGYFTYLNMPALSVRVAAAQAGINATYPDYHPDGYALNGPVTYGEGRVSMNFKSNSGTQGYTVSQSKSSWDSDAVLDDYVTPHAGSNYIPYTESGLTIYTFDNDAAWVNGGILYTIDGDAPLSSEQIRHIAVSLL
jgi:hypothetical protein